MDQVTTKGFLDDAVIIEWQNGSWKVHVTENGLTGTRDFPLEAAASAYADEQRIRLGIYRG